MQTMMKDKLKVRMLLSREEMGRAAAADCAARLRELLAQQEYVNMIFAAAPSQNETLAALVAAPDIDWTRVRAFHMDEYVGLAAGAPQGNNKIYTYDVVFRIGEVRINNRSQTQFPYK